MSVAARLAGMTVESQVDVVNALAQSAPVRLRVSLRPAESVPAGRYARPVAVSKLPVIAERRT